MKTFQVFTEDQEAQIVKLSTPTSKCFSQEIRHPSNHSSVKITAETRNGPFYVRLYTHYADKHTDVHSKVTTLGAAYKWASKHLGLPVKLKEIESDDSRLTLPTSDPDSMIDKSFTNY